MSWNWCSSTVFHIRSSVVVRVVGAGPHGGRRGPQLGLAQQVFAAPVALLGLGLGGVGGAVQLQVQLARPTPARPGTRPARPWRRTRRAAPTRTVGPSPRGPRAGAARRSSRGSGRHRRRRSRTAPASACHGLVSAKLRDAACAISSPDSDAVVGVDGREVGEDPGAVDALPPEGVVRELVGLVPRDLLGEEPARARQLDDLRQRRRRSRRCRAARPPRSRRRTRRGRSACRARTGGPSPRRRACWCRTRPTCRRPARTAVRDLLLTRAHTSGRCSFIHANCCACDIAKTKSGYSSISAVTLENVRAHLADRLAQRPQPGRVDVGVADRAETGARRRWRARRARRPAPRGRPRRCRRRPGGRARPGPGPSARRMCQRRARLDGQLLHQLTEHLEV